MAESVADIALDADDLFEPKTGIGVKRKAELADAEPVEDTAVGDNAGFGNCRTQRSTLKDSAGRVIYTCVCTLLAQPLVADGPKMFWELIQYFARLPWRAKKHTPEFGRWLRTPHVQTRLEELELAFGVERDIHFRPSRKMVLAKYPDMVEEELVTKYDIVVQTKTPWVQICFLSQRQARDSAVQEEALRLFRCFGDVVDFNLPVLAHLGAELPDCPAPKCDGTCIHIAGFVRDLKYRFGVAWAQKPVDALWLMSETECPALDTLYYQLFWQLAEAIELVVTEHGTLTDDADGQGVLHGLKKSRRLTKVMQQNPDQRVSPHVCNLVHTFGPCPVPR